MKSSILFFLSASSKLMNHNLNIAEKWTFNNSQPPLKKILYFVLIWISLFILCFFFN